MRKDFNKIVKLAINSKDFRTFENEHFIYWIFDDSYNYDGNKVSRDEYVIINNYATKYGTLPNLERKKRNFIRNKNNNPSEEISIIKSSNFGTYSSESVIRYSKKYDSLEFYRKSSEIRIPHSKNLKRVIAINKRINVFSIKSNGNVLFNNRWLSLKNWSSFKSNHRLSKQLIYELIDLMIGKDWIKEIELENYLISNVNARKANSLEEAVALECKCKPAKNIVKFFKGDINEIISLYNIIESNKINYITSFILKNKKIVELIDRKLYKKYYSLIFLYFLCRDNRCESYIVDDYIRMLQKLGKKINLKISSYSTIKANHDKAVRDVILKEIGNKSNLKIKKVYPNIKSTDEISVEKIKSMARLTEESEKLHHCVASYKDRINKGECAIYSLVFNENAYTMELQARERHVDGVKETYLYVNQLRGLLNCSPPIEMKEFFINICKEYNIESGEYIPFNQRNANKKQIKVIHIGDKILDHIDEYFNIKRVYDKADEEDSSIFEEEEDYEDENVFEW